MKPLKYSLVSLTALALFCALSLPVGAVESPGAFDLAAAGSLGLTVIWALALPGKTAPVTAGAAIRSTIYNMLREIGC